MIVKIKSGKYKEQKVLIDKLDLPLIPRGIYISQVGNYLYVKVNPSKQYLHRVIMKPPKDMQVDHINRNPLDNRRKNLRVVTRQGNLRNQKRGSNKTGFTGVAIYPGGKYSAQIKVNYKKHHLGLFKTIEEAYQARLAGEKLYYENARPICK